MRVWFQRPVLNLEVREFILTYVWAIRSMTSLFFLFFFVLPGDRREAGRGIVFRRQPWRFRRLREDLPEARRLPRRRRGAVVDERQRGQGDERDARVAVGVRLALHSE